MRVLGSAVLLAVLVWAPVGCGDRADTTGSDAASPSPTPPSSSAGEDSPRTEDSVGHELVAMLTATAAGGSVSSVAVLLDDADDPLARAFVRQFRSKDFSRTVRQGIRSASSAEGFGVYGAVVAVGCDVPRRVVVAEVAGQLSIRGVPVEDPLPECFAAMTTVALVQVAD